MTENTKVERYIGRRGDWFCSTDEDRTRLYPCIHHEYQRGKVYLDPYWARKTKFNKKEQAFIDALKRGDDAVVTVDGIDRSGKPHRVGYIGRFSIANARLDAAGLYLELVEQVARAVNVPPAKAARARRGRGSY